MKKMLKFLFIIYFVNSFESNKNYLKVFIIEINPKLISFQNSTLYKSNNEYFSHDRVRTLDEIKEDLQFVSHEQLTIDIVQYSILNEFPTYKKKINLMNGNSDYKFDENTYVSIAKNDHDKDKGDWFNLLHNGLFDEPGSYNFDYEYLIQKYNLISPKNKNMFDHIWILGIDPLSTFATMLV